MASLRGPLQPLEDSEDADQLGHDLGEAHDRDLRDVVERLEARLSHPRTAHAEEAGARQTGSELAHEGAGVGVSRGFPGDDEDVQRLGHAS